MITSNYDSLEEAREASKILEKVGIVSAYEYVLRRLCVEGLPTNNMFDKAAQYILEYERLLLEKKREKSFEKSREKDLKRSVEISKSKEKELKSESKYVKIKSSEELIAKKKIKKVKKKKMKEFAISNFALEIGNWNNGKNKQQEIQYNQRENLIQKGDENILKGDSERININGKIENNSNNENIASNNHKKNEESFIKFERKLTSDPEKLLNKVEDKAKENEIDNKDKLNEETSVRTTFQEKTEFIDKNNLINDSKNDKKEENKIIDSNDNILGKEKQNNIEKNPESNKTESNLISIEKDIITQTNDKKEEIPKDEFVNKDIKSTNDNKDSKETKEEISNANVINKSDPNMIEENNDNKNEMNKNDLVDYQNKEMTDKMYNPEKINVEENTSPEKVNKDEINNTSSSPIANEVKNENTGSYKQLRKIKPNRLYR